VQSTQTKTITLPMEKILNNSLEIFMKREDFTSAKRIVKQVADTGVAEYFKYQLSGMTWLSLVDKLDTGMVAFHEILLDNPERIAEMKRRLWISSGNFYRQLYNKETG